MGTVGLRLYITTKDVVITMSWYSRKLADIPGIRHVFLDVHDSAVFDKSQMVDIKQVHGPGILHFTETPLDRPHVDGVVTSISGQKVGVATADCLPLLMASGDGRVIASVHAGWRGTAQGVIERAVSAFAAQQIAAEDIVVAIGPHIRACCYEVSPAFYDGLLQGPCADAVREYRERLFFSVPQQPTTKSARAQAADGQWFDLPAFCLIQLAQAGIASGNIEVLEKCTYCTPDELGSYRRRTHHPATKTQQISWIEKI